MQENRLGHEEQFNTKVVKEFFTVALAAAYHLTQNIALAFTTYLSVSIQTPLEE